MQFVYNAIERCAASHASVFITGPSGAGKELAANAIHKFSPRKDKPLICLNCATIPQELMGSEIFGHIKGAFSGAISNRDGAATPANGGTLFLDKLGKMDIVLQAKILRFIQTGTF
ncbi:MAG: two-component system repressor protein LuxO [Paraglaciecola sp.]|jgi:two-component system repressor protein LuxO